MTHKINCNAKQEETSNAKPAWRITYIKYKYNCRRALLFTNKIFQNIYGSIITNVL